MYSIYTVLGWCLLSLLLGAVLAFAFMLVLLQWPVEYSEKGDWPDAEWAKDFEEIQQDGH